MLAFTLILLIITSGCQDSPLSISKADKGNFDIELLFEHDRCKVYRFQDGRLNTKYFTNCYGSTSWNESCGKNCTHEVGVKGK